MKIGYLAISLLAFASCQDSSMKKPPYEENLLIDSVEAISEKEYSIEGSWVLSSYLDSIVKHKSVSKYRIQQPAWTAIMLDISENDIKCFGSILDKKSERLKGDTLAIIEGINSSWNLIQNDSLLELSMIDGLGQWDSTIYEYRKSNDLAYLHEDESKGWPLTLDSSLTQFFNKELLSGSYLNIHNKDSVQFNEDGRLIGIENFESYEVRNYFGTSHNFEEMDVVRFQNKKNSVYWSFEINGSLVTLTELKGDWYKCDCYVKTKKQILLEKIILD